MSGPTLQDKYSLCPDATPANRFCLDFEAEAARFSRLPYQIIDVHSHVGGREASKIYRKAAELYGIGLTYSMTPLHQVEAVREVMGDRIRFIAVPDWRAEDKKHAMGYGFIESIRSFYDLGTRICKFWAAPRARDYAEEFGDPDFMALDAPHRLEAMEVAADLGMCFMAHIADPDTWFKTKYTDSSKYGTKRKQYEAFEMVLDRFKQPWIGAHFGGWPEDLIFLGDLLDRHDNLYLDASATKWIVREISEHPRDQIIEFLTRYKGRILFGSDIVSSDDHLEDSDEDNEMLKKASSHEEAFDLYASRYWALRTLWETDYAGESPIADPDLAMVDPQRHGELDAPQLRGMSLPDDLLKSFYHDGAMDLLDSWHQDQ
ncbi:MAG: amidohydrolase family protein [Planctomycetota bacterium]|nr:amidohydrolase family protein [Planctomycetota bacterium]